MWLPTPLRRLDDGRSMSCTSMGECEYEDIRHGSVESRGMVRARHRSTRRSGELACTQLRPFDHQRAIPAPELGDGKLYSERETRRRTLCTVACGLTQAKVDKHRLLIHHTERIEGGGDCLRGEKQMDIVVPAAYLERFGCRVYMFSDPQAAVHPYNDGDAAVDGLSICDRRGAQTRAPYPLFQDKCPSTRSASIFQP